MAHAGAGGRGDAQGQGEAALPGWAAAAVAELDKSGVGKGVNGAVIRFSAVAQLGENHGACHRFDQAQVFQGRIDVAGAVVAQAPHHGSEAGPLRAGQALIGPQLVVPAHQGQQPHHIGGAHQVAAAGQFAVTHQHPRRTEQGAVFDVARCAIAAHQHQTWVGRQLAQPLLHVRLSRIHQGLEQGPQGIGVAWRLGSQCIAMMAKER